MKHVVPLHNHFAQFSMVNKTNSVCVVGKDNDFFYSFTLVDEGVICTLGESLGCIL